MPSLKRKRNYLEIAAKNIKFSKEELIRLRKIRALEFGGKEHLMQIENLDKAALRAAEERKQKAKLRLEAYLRGKKLMEAERIERENAAIAADAAPIQCIQKCKFCSTITHSCSSEACKEPAKSVCSNEVCQAKFIILHYKKENEELKATLKEALAEGKEKLVEACRKLDHYRLIMIGPDAAKALTKNDALGYSTTKIYAAQNRAFWSALAREKESIDGQPSGELVITEWAEFHHEMRVMLMEVLQAEGLKLSIKKSHIEKTAVSHVCTCTHRQDNHQLNSGKCNVQHCNCSKYVVLQNLPAAGSKSISSPVKAGVPEWSKSNYKIDGIEYVGKAIYGAMKTFKCTKEEAEAWYKKAIE